MTLFFLLLFQVSFVKLFIRSFKYLDLSVLNESKLRNHLGTHEFFKINMLTPPKQPTWGNYKLHFEIYCSLWLSSGIYIYLTVCILKQFPSEINDCVNKKTDFLENLNHWNILEYFYSSLVSDFLQFSLSSA